MKRDGMMEKELKMKLLESLMETMDSSVGSKFKKEKEPMVMVKEEEVMPLSEAKEEIKEKLSEDMPEMEDDSEDEEDYGGSRLMEKIKELKKKQMGK